MTHRPTAFRWLCGGRAYYLGHEPSLDGARNPPYGPKMIAGQRRPPAGAEKRFRLDAARSTLARLVTSRSRVKPAGQRKNPLPRRGLWPGKEDRPAASIPTTVNRLSPDPGSAGRRHPMDHTSPTARARQVTGCSAPNARPRQVHITSPDARLHGCGPVLEGHLRAPSAWTMICCLNRD